MSNPQTGHGITFGSAVRVWLRIAALSFGGPAGQIAVMHRILVDEKRWIGERRFLHAVNFCMLLPGPEAQQLATYIGWLLHGVRGGLVAGLLFVLPGAAAIMALSWIYALYGHVGPIAALFFGVKAAVLAIVLQAVIRIGSRALKSTESRILAAVAFAAIFLVDAPFPLIVGGAGVIGYFASRRGSHAFVSGGHKGGADGLSDADSALGEGGQPAGRGPLIAAALLLLLWLGTVALVIGTAPPVFGQIAIFFSKLAVVTFGGAYAVLAYMAQAAVDTYHWLSPTEMLDGLGMAETTPGPLVMVTQYVGFMGAYRASGSLWAATLGGLLTTWVTFLPCFVWIFAGAPYVERLRANAALASALGAITAAVVGVILSLAMWFALHFVFGTVTRLTIGPVGLPVPAWSHVDVFALLLSAAAVVAVMRRANLFVLLGVTAAAGLIGRGYLGL